MKSRFALLALSAVVTLTVVACGKDSPSSPDPNAPVKFTATLNQANEFPAIANADASASGTATITFNVVKDAAGNITSATADFSVPMTGFPAGTTITAAHIHPGASGTSGNPLVNLGLTAGEIALSATGAGTITKTTIAIADPANAQAIINNPAGFYFNVHTSLSPGGAIRGQLVKQ